MHAQSMVFRGRNDGAQKVWNTARRGGNNGMCTMEMLVITHSYVGCMRAPTSVHPHPKRRIVQIKTRHFVPRNSSRPAPSNIGSPIDGCEEEEGETGGQRPGRKTPTWKHQMHKKHSTSAINAGKGAVCKVYLRLLTMPDT